MSDTPKKAGMTKCGGIATLQRVRCFAARVMQARAPALPILDGHRLVNDAGPCDRSAGPCSWVGTDVFTLKSFSPDVIAIVIMH